MDLGALDGALGPWRREREARAWERLTELRALEVGLRHEAQELRLRARAALGALGERVSGAAELEAQADRAKGKANWWRVCRLIVRRYEERRAGCGAWTFEGVCQHCGLCHSWPRRCGAHVACADCGKARAKRLARKLIPAIRLAHARATVKWHAKGRPKGGMPLITLMTLTVRSVDIDDLVERRKLLSDAWNRFRSWWQATYHTRLQYAWTVECTEGSKSQGHVHAHAVVMLPLVDYARLEAAWERATQGHGGHIDFSRKRSDPKRAARYLAKYASKGVKFESVQVAAAWVRAQHGRRGVSTSRDWWHTEDEHGPWELTLRRNQADDAGDDHQERPRHAASTSSLRTRAGPS